jgi:hypothetical protein
MKPLIAAAVAILFCTAAPARAGTDAVGQGASPERPARTATGHAVQHLRSADTPPDPDQAYAVKSPPLSYRPDRSVERELIKSPRPAYQPDRGAEAQAVKLSRPPVEFDRFEYREVVRSPGDAYKRERNSDQ